VFVLWISSCLTRGVQGNPFGSTALVEVVEDVGVAGQEAGERRRHAHGDARADHLHGPGPSAARHQEDDQEQRPMLCWIHFTNLLSDWRRPTDTSAWRATSCCDLFEPLGRAVATSA